MLKFLGSGSAFNTKLGNNSAYYKKDDQLLLIDCGSSIFQRIKENNILEGVKKIHVLITHTHTDHVGSLADLIFYSYYLHGEFDKNKLTVYSPCDTGVDRLLELNGCVDGTHFTMKSLGGSYDIVKIPDFAVFGFGKNNHVEELNTYHIFMNIEDKTIFYSSDCSKLDDEIIGDIHHRNNIMFYIDTCKADYKGNVHLSLRKLTEIISEDVRDRVWCMHLDEGFERKEAEQLGFNVVTNEF